MFVAEVRKKTDVVTKTVSVHEMVLFEESDTSVRLEDGFPGIGNVL